MSKWYNPLVTAVLRSPLHSVMSGNTLLLTYTGRKSQRAYTFPISYGQQGNDIYLITHRAKPWWKNVRGGAAVTMRVRGQDRPGQAEVLEVDPAQKLAHIETVYRGLPRAHAQKIVPDMVVVRVTLK
jgi:hypothetical protein